MEVVKLVTLTNRKIGYGIVQPGASVSNGVPVIKVNNIISGLKNVNELETTTTENDAKYKRTKLIGGELVISVVGTIGKTAIVPISFAGCNLVRATCLIDIKDELLTSWVKYYIDSPKGQHYIHENLNTTVQPTLNVKSLVDMPIPMYSPEYMRDAVSILKSLDDKIEVNRQINDNFVIEKFFEILLIWMLTIPINDNLEQQAQALFKSWFVDFEPFRDGEFVESELGLIPKGWRVGTLGELCNVFTGKKDVKQSKPIGLYPFFSCSPNHTYSNEYIYDGPSIIIAGNGSYTGRTSFYFGKFDLYQRTYACIIKEGFNEKIISFLYYMMKCLFEPVKMGGTRGSSIPYIVMNDIVLQKFALDNSLVEKYSDFAYNVMKQIQQNNQESRRLATLRDTLLPKLMSGELKVFDKPNDQS